MRFKGLIVSSLLLFSSQALSLELKDCLKSKENCLSYMSQVSGKVESSGVNKLKLECEAGYAYWCLALGYYFDKKQDVVSAEKFFRQGCKLKSPKSCVEGGYLLERQGKEAESDDMYTFACGVIDEGDDSCLALAQNFREKSRYDKALKYYSLACDQNNPQGCYNASEIANFNSTYEIIKQDRKFKFLKKGCDLDHGLSCMYVGETLLDRGYKESALAAYQKACLKQIDYACEKFKEVNGRGLGEELTIKYDKWKKSQLKKVQDVFEYFFPIGPRKP